MSGSEMDEATPSLAKDEGSCGARSVSARNRFSNARRSITAFTIDPLLIPEDVLDDDDLNWWQKIRTFSGGQLGNFIALWVIWLLTGTIFYAEAMDLGYGKGFYMAVNTGYSIGWGDISEDKLYYQWFSLFYVLAGASFVGMALGFFADSVVADCNNWYINAQIEHKFDKDYDEAKHYVTKFFLWCEFHWTKVRAVVAWSVFVAAASVGSCVTQDWPFVTGLYFAVSSMSTGGLQALEPLKTSEVQYFFTGVLGALGVPLMGVAMATLAGFFIETGDIKTTMSQIREDITADEIDMLVDLDLADADGTIDKTEFIILCMVRTGAADPLLIKLIKEYFDILDEDGSGDLDLKEITASAKEVAQHTRERVANSNRADGGRGVQRRLSIQDIKDQATVVNHATDKDKAREEKELSEIFTAQAIETKEELDTINVRHYSPRFSVSASLISDSNKMPLQQSDVLVEMTQP